jgi:hypothetical protein
MPAIHRTSLVWLKLTFSTSPSKTTIQIHTYSSKAPDWPWDQTNQPTVAPLTSQLMSALAWMST